MTFLPDGWEERPLGELVDILDGRRVPVNAKERAERPGVVPYYGATGQVGWIDQSLFDEPLVLLGEDGVQFLDRDKAKAYGITGPAWVNNHAHVLRARDEVMDRRYLVHYLNWVDYSGLANGTTRLKLTQAAMRRIAVRLPAREEQRRIVDRLEDHLSRLDAGRAYADSARRKNQSALAAWCERLVWKRADRTRTIGSLLREPMRNGLSARASQHGTTRVLTLTAVTKNSFSDAFTKLVDVDARKAANVMLASGDILVQRSNTPELVGSAALYEGPNGWAIYPDLMIRLRCDEAVVMPQYMTLALRSARAQRYFRSRAKGLAGSMPKIDQSTISELKVPLPSLDEQRRSMAVAKELTEQASRLDDAVRKATARAGTLRRALLEAAFSGRLTGRTSDIGIAEELAERRAGLG
ncbi:hypothetical protein DQ239_15815 [Blastococcus sp. TF02-09]|uniref:restriction endonuclease subunit S n=1 Tax=Blastococcus sp. TF02-09 TaxID=2250576 RepID=UPI000DE94E6F|nr:restriction endonuclease subunit S [Blastococcus sp. TF02-9]RBY75970.1 hypothetical protein DQ239_15815 [Blastococcus sp. TF02-9]